MKVAIIMGSTSDLDIMSQAINVLEGFGVEVVKRVISAHRTPDLMCEFAKSAKAEGIGVIIAGAGGAAHVAGVVAGMTKMSFKYFFWTNIVARGVGIASTVFLGSGSVIPFHGWGLLVWGVLILVVGVLFYLSVKYQNKLDQLSKRLFKRKKS